MPPMPAYAAVLGHQPVISVAELAAAVPGFSLQKIISKQVALFESTETLPKDMMERLGGTIFLAESISEAPLTLEDIPQAMVNETSSVKKKITFSLRCYGLASKDIRDVYRKCKERFRRENRTCRYVGNERKPAVAVLLHDSDIVSGKKGCELFIIAEGEDLWVGRTIGAQDVNAYTKRDTEKPVRDTTVGLLPPKLAQMLLNFGVWMLREDAPKGEPKKRKKEVYTVLDPFCGTGVIPLESMLLGWNVLCSDTSQKAVNGCKKNVEWLRKEYGILKKDVTSEIWKQDALKPFKLKELPDMIITETTLGPALAKRPSKTEVTRILRENENIQAEFLENAAKTLPGVPIICTWPVWKTKDDTVQLEKIWDAIEENGYQPVIPAGVTPTSSSRLTLVYRRKDQFVGREIVMLKPKK
jgi:hypothetical protein